jgi:dTDP-4-amino-4,6-dideoxygalactose transaminase
MAKHVKYSIAGLPKVPITRPHLPDLDQFTGIVAELFQTRLLSNFGKYGNLLEKRAAEVLDHPAPLCVVNCDVGLALAWRALGCATGEVIVPSFTFCSTVNAIHWNGLTPVFADIDPQTFCIDVEHVQRLISPRTVGIAAVHVYGCPAAVTELEALARQHGLKLLFDAAHGLGTAYQGRGVGACGDASVFSLSGTKVVTAAEGGLATFRDPEAAERFRRLRGYGFIGDYNCTEVGLNGKLSELHAALGWLSLDLLKSTAAQRHQKVAFYFAELSGLPDISFQVTPAGCVNGYKDFAVLFRQPAQRAAVEQALTAAGVQTKRYFLPCHRMTAYAGLAAGPLPVTDHVYERVLCLPLFHDLADERIWWICRLVASALRSAEGREVGLKDRRSAA